MATDTNKSLRNDVIYSIYVRAHTQEGTFKAIEPDLERIKKLGVDIIWFMPIYPIGEKNRKGKLGSPYAIKDYRAVNPEYGTMADFLHLVNSIHKLGMKCIIDIVYNHTSPDSWLVNNHPEWFYHKPNGDMGNHVGDWTDIVDLDYSNKKLWKYQIETLKKWAKYVDGFRCDVASLVPLNFWKEARKACSKVKKNLIWLAESVHYDFIRYLRANNLLALSDSEVFQAFDITYDYDVREFFDRFIKKEISFKEYIDILNFQDGIYPENYVKLRFLENHDQPRIASLIKDERERYNYFAFNYFQKGTTLIYAGEEFGETRLPSLFDKETITPQKEINYSDCFRALYKIKKDPIFALGTYELKTIKDFETVIISYKKNNEEWYGIFALGNYPTTINLQIPAGTYTNLIGDETFGIKDNSFAYSGFPTIIKVIKH